MIEQRCGTCKYFEYSDDDRLRGAPGACQVIDEITDIIDDLGDCCDLELRPELLARPAYIYSIREYSYLAVQPTFGCVLHEPKQTPADPPAD